MNKGKIILAATGLLTVVGLTSCGNSRDVKPQYNIGFANCYVKDRSNSYEAADESWHVFPKWAYAPQTEEEEEDQPDQPDVPVVIAAHDIQSTGPFYFDPPYIYEGSSYDGQIILNDDYPGVLPPINYVSINYFTPYGEEINITNNCGYNPLEDFGFRRANLFIPSEYSDGNISVSILLENTSYNVVNVANKIAKNANARKIGGDEIRLNYIATGDKANDGRYTVTGNTVYQVGDDLDLTLTLDDFVTLNPVDGDLVEDETSKTGYRVDNPVYFKIYVSENSTYAFNELSKDYYTIQYDESNPKVIKFHIPGKYVKYSYKVYFSASYVDIRSLGFGGVDTLDFRQLERTKMTEFEKFVPSFERNIRPIPDVEEASIYTEKSSNRGESLLNSCYRITNSKVGGDNFACLITPSGAAGGVTFSDDYLSKLQFFGRQIDLKTLEVKYIDITDAVHTNLVHCYGNIADRIVDPLTEASRHINYIYPTNMYKCRFTIPWVNTANPSKALFTYKDGNYSLNYDGIFVTVKDQYVDDKLPSYIEKSEILSKVKVDADSKSISSATVDYEYYLPELEIVNYYSPIIKISATLKDGYDFGKNCINSIKVISKESIEGYKYFKDLVINDSDDIERALSGEYIDSDYCLYTLGHCFSFERDREQKNKFNFIINLERFLNAISFGPGSYGTILRPATNRDVIMNKQKFDFSASLDMVERIELGIFGNDNTGKR